MERNMVRCFSSRSSRIHTNETNDFQVLENYSSAMAPITRANSRIMKSWDKEHDILPPLEIPTRDISTTVIDRAIFSSCHCLSLVASQVKWTVTDDWSNDLTMNERKSSTVCSFRMGNGDCYEGDFKGNRFEGEGSYLSHDKQLYTGNWHHHRRHGYGEQTYFDGSRYSGDWVSNQRHGFGKLTDTQDNSVIYEVNVEFSKSFVANDWWCFQGSWKNDLMHGEGTYTVGESYSYRNGMLVNNYPIGWPFHFRINEQSTPTSIVLSDQPMILTVDMVDSSEESQRVEADCGRLIRLRCGLQTDKPTSDSVPTPL